MNVLEQAPPSTHSGRRAAASPLKGEEGGGGEHYVYLMPICAYENLA
jgi:hypothetical protein